MKKIYLFLIAILTFASCNVIKQDDRYIEIEQPEASERTVLLMDFTGWKCVNCPDAARTAAQISEMYPENCIVVSMHPEGMTFTDPGSDGPKLASKQAMDYLKAFGGSVGTGLPKGVIDMTEYKGEYLNTHDRWTAAVFARMEDTAHYAISISADEKSYSVDLSCVSGTPAADTRLLVWLVEDSIEGRQLTKEGEITDYQHRHVFRKCLNGDIWGEDVFFDFDNQASATGDITLPEAVGKHFIVVAVLVDGDHHVLQAAETEIGAVKNPGFFTIKDAANEVEYNNGDTITTTHFLASSGEIIFEGNINIDDQSDVDFYLDEERDFSVDDYMVSFCAFGNCLPDMNNGHWGPFDAKKSTTYDFSHHIMIPQEQQSEPHTFTIRMTFSNGNPLATKFIVVRYVYTPE